MLAKMRKRTRRDMMQEKLADGYETWLVIEKQRTSLKVKLCYGISEL